jgi:hypothetical protein
VVDQFVQLNQGGMEMTGDMIKGQICPIDSN